VIITVCDKVTGRKITLGDNAPGTKVARLLDEGHIRVESEPPSEMHYWNGSSWVEDAALAALVPLKTWEASMRRSDAIMTRTEEQIIDAIKGSVTLDAGLLERHATKKALRAARPQV
jgi:hypothetical protein